ncbi:uncharacterized protein LOC116275428 [Papio anubis]|uniref:uncharacterized protein LOC116275428 n=1 Tax=Papio anubis TaxID=9555 RepID=UPI0012AE90E5|nr:uncharacterized protein LOC116275428 [Papio anubis]
MEKPVLSTGLQGALVGNAVTFTFSACAGPQTGSLKTAEVHSSPPDQAGCALRELSGPPEAPSLPAQFSCADPSAAGPGPGEQRNRGEKCAHVVRTDGPVSLPTEKRTARRSPEGEACRGGRTRQTAAGLPGSRRRRRRRPPHACSGKAESVSAACGVWELRAPSLWGGAGWSRCLKKLGCVLRSGEGNVASGSRVPSVASRSPQRSHSEEHLAGLRFCFSSPSRRL